jgi:hypothetical protein
MECGRCGRSGDTRGAGGPIEMRNTILTRRGPSDILATSISRRDRKHRLGLFGRLGYH